ncbi:glycoprotein-N-acetylgalactosamine 3-beta-galactosyltransferase 1-like [Saccostrea echinata]|uniref:glycoprotein-N-acetylgalactosamine 3-beta-galactosyltransferase 1-like n=1 Tax=Saccostrea echinata TaxID=191078 RepID=UPI002A7FB0C1|nr:glycoprotein-N-acetylgalactosamine 3-beta-galactosyltransferase 1-like [Saccostrea echinata]
MTNGLSFLSGFICGIILYFVAFPSPSIFFIKYESTNEDKIVRTLFENYYLDEVDQIIPSSVINDSKFHRDNNTLGTILQEKVKVHCVIFTSDYFGGRLLSTAVANTWAKRCSSAVFVGRKTNQHLPFPMIYSNISFYRSDYDAKSVFGVAVLETFKRHLNNNDWFLFAADNTFVILENLRYYLSKQNASEPIYFGTISNAARGMAWPFHSGITVFSKASMKKLKQSSIVSCKESVPYEFTSSLCLRHEGILDKTPLERYGTSIINNLPLSISAKLNNPMGIHMQPNSYMISLRFLQSQDIYAHEFLVYHLRAFGINKLST